MTAAKPNAPTMVLADVPARSESPREEMNHQHGSSTEHVTALAACYDLLRAIGRRHQATLARAAEGEASDG